MCAMPGNNRKTKTVGAKVVLILILIAIPGLCAKVVLILILIAIPIPGLCDHSSRSLAWPGV